MSNVNQPITPKKKQLLVIISIVSVIVLIYLVVDYYSNRNVRYVTSLIEQNKIDTVSRIQSSNTGIITALERVTLAYKSQEHLYMLKAEIDQLNEDHVRFSTNEKTALQNREQLTAKRQIELLEYKVNALNTIDTEAKIKTQAEINSYNEKLKLVQQQANEKKFIEETKVNKQVNHFTQSKYASLTATADADKSKLSAKSQAKKNDAITTQEAAIKVKNKIYNTKKAAITKKKQDAEDYYDKHKWIYVNTPLGKIKTLKPSAALKEFWSNAKKAFNKAKGDIDRELTKGKASIDATLTKAKSDIDSELTKAKQTIDTELTVAKSNVDNEATKLKQSLDAELTIAKNKIDKEFTAQKQNLDASLTQSKKSIDKQATAAKEHINNKAEQIKSELDNSLTQYKQTIDKVLTQSKTELDKKLTALNKNIGKTITIAKADIDRELTKSKSDLDQVLTKAKSDMDREATLAQEQISAILKACSQPENLARMAFIYGAGIYGGPYGAALANAILDKLENPNMSEQDILKSFAIGAVASYAGSSVSSYNAVTSNVAKDIGEIVLNGKPYSSQDFFASVATGAIVIDIDDNISNEVLESSLNALKDVTIDNIAHGQTLDPSTVSDILLQGAADSVTSQVVSGFMDEYIVPTIDNLTAEETEILIQDRKPSGLGVTTIDLVDAVLPGTALGADVIRAITNFDAEDDLKRNELKIQALHKQKEQEIAISKGIYNESKTIFKASGALLEIENYDKKGSKEVREKFHHLGEKQRRSDEQIKSLESKIKRTKEYSKQLKQKIEDKKLFEKEFRKNYYPVPIPKLEAQET
jgi:hypothetical protein